MTKCNRCGWCCRQEVCPVGLEVIPDAKPPCPFLTDTNLCLIIIEANKMDEGFGADMELRLGIGLGCPDHCHQNKMTDWKGYDSSINIQNPINEGVELCQ